MMDNISNYLDLLARSLKNINSSAAEEIKLLKIAITTEEVNIGLTQGLVNFNWLYKARNLRSKTGLVEFIENNSDILSNFDVKKYLGSGLQGDAFLLDDNQVLKIYVSETDDYRSFQDSLFQGKGNKSLPMIYQTGTFRGKLKNEEVGQLRYVVMEYVPQTFDKKYKQFEQLTEDKEEVKNYFQRYLPTLSQKIPELYFLESHFEGNNLNDFFKSYCNNVIFTLNSYIGNLISQNQKDLPEIKQIYNQSEYKNALKPIKQFLGLNNNWDQNLIDSIYHNLIRNKYDLHTDNFGMRNDDVVFYDG